MITVLDLTIASLLGFFIILGGYQVYLLPQKHPLKPPRSLHIPLDEMIPFRPKWVWIYSFLYYPFIISTIATLSSFKQFAYVAANFILLLTLQLTIAFLFPVKAPTAWREYDPQNSISERFLSFVQSIDGGGNCFPSMHVGLATLASIHIVQNTLGQFGPVVYMVFLAPALIALSTVFTKQHFVVDIPAGAALGAAVFSVHTMIYS